jgi:hypothetical protein
MARRRKNSDPTRREQRKVQILLAEDSLGDVVLVRKALEAIDIPFELSVVSHGEELLNYLVNALELDGFIDKTLGPAGFIEQLKFIEHYWSREGKVIYPGSKARH